MKTITKTRVHCGLLRMARMSVGRARATQSMKTNILPRTQSTRWSRCGAANQRTLWLRELELMKPGSSRARSAPWSEDLYPHHRSSEVSHDILKRERLDLTFSSADRQISVNILRCGMFFCGGYDDNHDLDSTLISSHHYLSYMTLTVLNNACLWKRH
jgi:hypothetical protein